MCRALRALALTGALALLPAPALLPGLAGGSCASAAGARQAALVVVTGSQTLRLCITLDAAKVSGLHLIELAHAQRGLQYAFGFGGLAVCQLDGVGPPGSDCFGAYPDFWGMWIGDGSGGWSWSGSGAGSVYVPDGGIQAWVWGTGDTAATHHKPPRTTEVSVCGASDPTAAPALAPASTPTSQAGKRSAPSPKPTRDPSRSPGSLTATAPSDPATVTGAVVAAGPGDVPKSGLPAGIPLGIGAILALGLAGWMRIRTGSRSGPGKGGG